MTVLDILAVKIYQARMNTVLYTVFMRAWFFLVFCCFFLLLIMSPAAVAVSMAVMLAALMVMAAHGIRIIIQTAV